MTLLTLTDADIDLAVEVAYLALPEQQRPHLGGAPLWRAIYRAAYAAGRAEAIAEAARVCDAERELWSSQAAEDVLSKTETVAKRAACWGCADAIRALA